MIKKWHEDNVVSDWNYTEKRNGYFAVTGKTKNKQWERNKIGKEYEHERIWND
jgi:hypothetical protein